MSESLDTTFFAGNRQKLRQLVAGNKPIIITANSQLQMATTEPYPFKQDSNFWYLTGIYEPETLLVIEKDWEYLILPKRSDYLEIFTGQQFTEQLSRQSGITEVLDNKIGLKRLKQLLKNSKQVAILAPPSDYIEVYGMYSNPARANLSKQLKTFNANVNLVDIRQHLAQLRMVKQEPELAALKKAINITEKTLIELAQTNWNKFKSTFDIETAIINSFRSGGAEGASFESVIAAGADTCVMHSRPNRKPLPKKGPLLLDVGALLDNYCADISRTYFLSSPTKRQQEVFVAVQEVQEYAMSLLKPGALIKTNEQKIENFMGEKLKSLNLIKTIERTTVRKYYPHACSHHLGIDVHDVANYDAPLSKNMVITVEPGIYIQEEGFGVRLEDDVLITKDGIEVLSTKAPQQLW